MRKPFNRSRPPLKRASEPQHVENLAALEARLGYRFKEQALLRVALSHQSALEGPNATSGESYQRLEFLGDRVLGLAVSDMLYRVEPQVIVGRLARRLSDLVRAETCAEVAEDWSLGEHIHFGANVGADTRQSRSVLADVCEAVLGAIYLDGGFAASTALIEKFWRPRLNDANVTLQDPKTALQEWAQGRGLLPPAYTDLERTGPDHDPRFTVRVDVPGFEPCEAQSSAKKLAQQSAAEAFLMRENIWTTGSKFSRKSS